MSGGQKVCDHGNIQHGLEQLRKVEEGISNQWEKALMTNAIRSPSQVSEHRDRRSSCAGMPPASGQAINGLAVRRNS
jgi:hypothetical protein